MSAAPEGVPPHLRFCKLRVGVVAIGRNEGTRLKRCIESLSAATLVVYVDSGSRDGSAQWVSDQGIMVYDLDLSLPFTAARARNAGLRRLLEIAPDLPYVQFVDGDCELVETWLQRAVSFMETHPEVAALSGRLRERFPNRSVYNWLCDREWDGPVGEVRACGGIAMMRTIAIEAIGGYRDDMIAGEEPELCIRLRASGWRVWRLDADMALHDAAMTRFVQWWRRSMRAGYGDACGAYLHGASPERHRVWESRRAWLWGAWLPFACLLIGMVFGPLGWAAWTIYPLQGLRQTLRNHGPPGDRVLLALYQVLARFPEVCGQIKFHRDRVLGRHARLIEYK